MTAIYPQRSDWAEEPPLTSYKSSSHITIKDDHEIENSVGLVSDQKQSTSPYLPVVLGLIIGLLSGGIVLGAVIAVWLTTSTITTTTTTTTTTSLPIITAIWNFNGNTDDQYNIYNGIAVNTPSYATGYTNLTGTALKLNAAASQYVNISNPFLNLTYRSFTVEIWFYPTTLVSIDYGLFGQCQTASMDLCLAYMIRNNCAYLGFYSDDQSGVTTLTVNLWYHVAFVYDYSTSTQSLYLNGVLEGSRSSNPYQGMAGSIVIGAIDNGTIYYFTGRIDQVSLITQAKSADEILDDATLVCYFSFDSNTSADSGPLNLIGSSVNVIDAVGDGIINDAISFAVPSSYFVVGGLLKLGIVGQPYSISIWIKPTSVNGGTIAHVTKCGYSCVSLWCLAFIGFTSGGHIAIQSWRTSNVSNLVSLTGPVAPINAWTHVVQTYSPINGMCLYMNGSLVNQSSSFTYSASGASNYIYLGSFPWAVCVGSNAIAMGQYYGLLDEFRLYSREITANEVSTLAQA